MGLVIDSAGRMIAGRLADPNLYVVNSNAELTKIGITGAFNGTVALATFPCPPKCGLVYAADTMGGIIEIDVPTGSSTFFNTLKVPFTAMAFTGEGDLYGISPGSGSEGDSSYVLYKADTISGETTLVSNLIANGYISGLSGLPDDDGLVVQASVSGMRSFPDIPSLKEVSNGDSCIDEASSGDHGGDLVYNPSDDQFYSVKKCSDCTGDQLIRIDPETQQLEAVGCFAMKGSKGSPVSGVRGLAIDSLGRIIAGRATDSLLYVVNPANAELTRINIGGDYEGTVGLASFPCLHIAPSSAPSMEPSLEPSVDLCVPNCLETLKGMRGGRLGEARSYLDDCNDACSEAGVVDDGTCAANCDEAIQNNQNLRIICGEVCAAPDHRLLLRGGASGSQIDE